MLAAWHVVVVAVVAQRGPDPALLRPAVNLVSNCSFEATDAEGQPLGWHVAEGFRWATVSDRRALHGRRCLLISTARSSSGKAGGLAAWVRPIEDDLAPEIQAAGPGRAAEEREESAEGRPQAERLALSGQGAFPAVWQAVSVQGGVDYFLSAWVRATASCTGASLIAVEFRDDTGQPLGRQEASCTDTRGEWAAVTLRFTAPPGTDRALIQMLAPPEGEEMAVDAVSLTRADGKPSARRAFHEISNLRVAFLQPTWVLLAWDGTAASFVVEWRRAGKRFQWQRATGVTENFYSVVDLAPKATYEARVSATRPPFYDEHGREIIGSAPAQWGVISLRTPATEPQRWAGFRVWPAVHLNTFPDGVTGTALEAVGDRLYVAEARAGALYLSSVVPETWQVEWTKVVVEPVPDAEVSAPDMCAVGGQLWIAWDRVSRAGSAPQPTRRCLTSWDLATGMRREINIIEPSLPGASTAGGSVAAFRGGLWLAWVEEPADGHASRLLVAPFDTQAGLGTRVIWDDCPVSHPKDPCLVPTDGDLGMSYTDLPKGDAESSYEPLLWASFARQRFTGLRALLSFGRVSCPRGLQLGPFVVLAFEAKTRLERLADRFTDICLMRLGPGAGDITTFPYADDYKHNTRPDLALCQGDVYVAYTKFEREPQAGTQPPKSYGTYLGRLEPEVRPGL